MATDADFNLIEQSNLSTDIEDISRTDDLSQVEFFELRMLADKRYRHYNYESSSLLGYLGDIGGIQEIVIGIGFAIMMPLVVHSMNSQLVNEVYQVQ